jgi:hypothetical protein
MSEKDGQNDGIPWNLVLGLLGASVGVTFALYVVGAIVETRRFDALKLPGAQTITAVSRDSLVAVGGRALAAPFLAAVLALVLFYGMRAAGRWKGVGPVVVALLLVLSMALVVGATGLVTWENAGFVGLVAVGSALGWWHFRKDAKSNPRHAAVVGLGIAGIVSIVVLVHIWRPPVDLEYAEVDLTNEAPACGVYLTLTSDALYLAPASARDGNFYTHRRVVVLPRANIVRITLTRKVHVWDGGSGASEPSTCPLQSNR